MGREDWYRNETWDDGIEAVFRAKLARSRSSRPQYIKIQASHLAETYPLVALRLIDDYFSTGEDFFTPDALCACATAYRTLGRISEAIASYRQALAWEEEHPGLTTTARIDYPRLVVEYRLREEYDRALDVLATRFSASDHHFAALRYEWNGCAALIAHDLGQRDEAIEMAQRAMRAAGETRGRYDRHPDVGLVRNTSDDFGRRLKRIARTSFLRTLSRKVTSRRGT